MKLQLLLDKHKDKLWDGLGQLVIDSVSREQHNTIIIDLFIDGEPTCNFSLSDLLFSTQFVNLLNWKKEIWLSQLYSEVINMDSSDKVKIKLTTTGYHTCRLAILDDDKSRIEYIETFTL